MTYKEYEEMWKKAMDQFNELIGIKKFYIMNEIIYINNNLCGYDLRLMYQEYCKSHNE